MLDNVIIILLTHYIHIIEMANMLHYPTNINTTIQMLTLPITY